MRTYLLVGNYGVGNAGDEALKEYFLQRFPEVEWVVLSAAPRPSEVPRLPCGMRSLFLTPWWRTMRAYAHCEGVVCGGGSLFTDVESSFAPVLWAWHAALAVLFRKPIFLAFQGIGPFRTRLGEWCARWVVQWATFLSVRDTLSLACVERWKLNKKCILSFDPVFSLVGTVPKDLRLRSSSAAIPATHSSPAIQPGPSMEAGRSKILLIIPRKNSSKEFRRRMAEVRRERQERGVSGERVMEPASFRELCADVASASFLLTQRYHAGIVALALGVPFEAVPQVLGDKLDALNHEDRDLLCLRERVLVGEDALRSALKIPSPFERYSSQPSPCPPP